MSTQAVQRNPLQCISPSPCRVHSCAKSPSPVKCQPEAHHPPRRQPMQPQPEWPNSTHAQGADDSTADHLYRRSTDHAKAVPMQSCSYACCSNLISAALDHRAHAGAGGLGDDGGWVGVFGGGGGRQPAAHAQCINQVAGTNTGPLHGDKVRRPPLHTARCTLTTPGLWALQVLPAGFHSSENCRSAAPALCASKAKEHPGLSGTLPGINHAATSMRRVVAVAAEQSAGTAPSATCYGGSAAHRNGRACVTTKAGCSDGPGAAWTNIETSHGSIATGDGTQHSPLPPNSRSHCWQAEQADGWWLL